MWRGVIYPVLQEHFDRIASGKDVFCKFVSRGKLRLEVGDKILFYRSGGSREVIGEATIGEMEFLEPGVLVAKYGERLFLSRDELVKYVNQREKPGGKKLPVFVLKDSIKYPRPFKMKKSLTMAGLTLTKKMYQRITKNA